MNTESTEKRCPKCQAPVPAEAPQGLCPKCVLAAVSAPTEAGAPAESRPAPPPLEAIAAAFPQLEILELIGQGGMGLVYKARQPKLERFVALKLLQQASRTDPAFTERFNREARLLARLSHPNIVAVHDFGQSGAFFYLLMEFVDGVNLRQAMRAGRFTPSEALALVPKICEALQYAHDEGVLHRDIKPENILLDTRGRVKIADFGIGKLIGETTKERTLTASGAAIGTPHYMAPEQLERPHEVDHRADIYSLGVVFYEMLTGELPIGRFAPPSQKTPMDSRVDEVVLRALEKERERRFQSAGEVKTQVEHIATTVDPAASQKPSTPPAVAAPTSIPTPAWVNRAAILFIVFGLVAFLPTLTSFGQSVQVWHTGSLLVLTGIALLTRHWRWRIAALIGSSIALFTSGVSFTTLLLMATRGARPADWTLGVAGIPDSAWLAILLSLAEDGGFVAALWILCRPDVKALFTGKPSTKADRETPFAPDSPPSAARLQADAAMAGDVRWLGKALTGAALVLFSLVTAFPLALGWILTASYVSLAAPGPQLEVVTSIPRVMITGVPAALALAAAFSGTLLGVLALGEIRRRVGEFRGAGLALFASLCWPLLVLDALFFLGVSSLVSGLGAELSAVELIRYLTFSTFLTCAVGALVTVRVWRWATLKHSY